MSLPWSRGRVPVALLAAAVVALVVADVAGADRERVHLTAAGGAAARAAVLQRADFGAATGWTGGSQKPDLSSRMTCTGYRPKQSDLVLTGAAKTVWKHVGLQIESVAQVLETPAMVGLDWQRTVLAPQVLPCMRSELAKNLGPSERLVSLRRIAFPQLAPYARAYRALVDVTTATGTVQVVVDVVLLGRGRTELTLSTTAPLLAVQTVQAAEVRLGRLLVARIRA